MQVHCCDNEGQKGIRPDIDCQSIKFGFDVGASPNVRSAAATADATRTPTTMAQGVPLAQLGVCCAPECAYTIITGTSISYGHTAHGCVHRRVYIPRQQPQARALPAVSRS